MRKHKNTISNTTSNFLFNRGFFNFSSTFLFYFFFLSLATSHFLNFNALSLLILLLVVEKQKNPIIGKAKSREFERIFDQFQSNATKISQ